MTSKPVFNGLASLAIEITKKPHFKITLDFFLKLVNIVKLLHLAGMRYRLGCNLQMQIKSLV